MGELIIVVAGIATIFVLYVDHVRQELKYLHGRITHLESEQTLLRHMLEDKE